MAKRKHIWHRPTDKQKRQRLYHVHVRLTQFRIDEVREFIDHSRSGMTGEWKRFSSRFDEATKGIDQEEVSEYVDTICDDMAQLRDISPKLNRQSHCIMLYGTFESGLANMCYLVDRHQLVSEKLPKQLHMKDVKTYLAAHISKRAWGKEWQWMDELRAIRNAFAHSGGRVERQIDKATNKPIPGSRWASVTKFLHRNPKVLTLTKHDEVVIENGLIDRALVKADIALQKFHKAVYRLYQ